MTVRRAVKRAFERVLRLGRARPARMAGRSLILAYHNVVADQDQGLGDASLHLSLSSFVRQLDLLEAHCQVLPLADLLAGPAPSDRPHVAITFDDAYRGAVELAMPELARRGFPSTLFVAPGLLGRQSFWWDALAGDAGRLAPDVRKHSLEIREGRHDMIGLSGGRLDQGRGLPASYRCAGEEQIRDLHRAGPVTLGAHSWSHPNLTRIGPAALVEELTRPLEWLREADGPILPVVAYPYGLVSPEVAAAAEGSGYAAGLLVEGGWFNRRSGPWRIPRFNVPAGLSEDGLILRLSGVLPLS
jgi:peptidoglycan/xylan/chitin deacetylase (PgdA/CDA1 family)